MFSKKNNSINNNEKKEYVFSFYNKQGKIRFRQISSSNSLINNKNNDYNSSNSTQQSLLNENKKEKIKKEYDKKGDNSILIDNNINDNVYLNFKKIVKSKSNINNRINTLKNTSNYLLNIDEYFPNEKLNNVYNSNKMAFITQ